ncbi:MAG: hypothetical protein Q4F67_04985 [Propionibacteriaceae bacterium]|nr:hypothetical protein [Propionibacteriaceae bacterium]
MESNTRHMTVWDVLLEPETQTISFKVDFNRTPPEHEMALIREASFADLCRAEFNLPADNETLVATFTRANEKDLPVIASRLKSVVDEAQRRALSPEEAGRKLEAIKQQLKDLFEN